MKYNFKCSDKINGNVSEWDDVSDKYKPRPISHHESLAEDLCDDGDG